ncbi:MAG: primosomal protein N', partial [Verrucomicrobiota bacterium]
HGFYEEEMEFRRQLNYPPLSRIALLLLRGRNEEKVKFSADYLKRELEKKTAGMADLAIKGPAAAPLARTKTEYRFQIMLLTRQMSRLSLRLAELAAGLALPEEVKMTVDIDPVNLM